MRFLSSWVSLTLLTSRVVGHGGLANYTVGETWYRGLVHINNPFRGGLLSLSQKELIR